MPYSCFEKKCRRIKGLLCLPLFFICINVAAQVRWDGEAGDGLWTTAANWVGNAIPLTNDDVLLDNNIVAGNYIVSLAGAAAVTVRTITLSPAAGNIIQFVLPVSNTNAPALTATGPGYGITINNGGVLVNAAGSTSTAALAISDSFRINNGGHYIHNTRSAHASLVAVLSKLPGTETGIFEFDVPGGGYTLSSSNRTYGTLVLSAAASGGSQTYATTAGSPLTINGDFILKAGVVVNFDLTAATTIKGNYKQEGGVFNLASQSNNNTVYVKGDFIQTAGVITETAGGLPAIELNGESNQNIEVAGSVTNSVALRINNNAGVSLLSNVSLPYQLSLVNGIVHPNLFLITLQAGCRIIADSLNNNGFISGPLRKEGLLATAHFLFPVGKGTTQRWIAVKEVSGNYTAEFFKGNPNTLAMPVGTGINHTSSIEYWSVKTDAMPAPVAKIELSFDNVNSGGVTDMSALRVAQLQSGVWTDGGNSSTTGTPGSAGSVVSNSINMFEAGNTWFTLASSNAFQNPLPVKLVSFEGSSNNTAIVVSWKIQDGWQPAYFELQASGDGNYFVGLSKINEVAGALMYQYADKRKLSGKQYYRLKIFENDGLSFYSNIIATAANEFVFAQLQPTLVKNASTLFIHADAGYDARVNITNMQGSTVQAIAVSVRQGMNTILLQLQQLPAGIYNVTITGAGSKKSTCRFVKLE